MHPFEIYWFGARMDRSPQRNMLGADLSTGVRARAWRVAQHELYHMRAACLNGSNCSDMRFRKEPSPIQDGQAPDAREGCQKNFSPTLAPEKARGARATKYVG